MLERVRPSVVAVFVPGGGGGGSGVLISPDGFALTNFHVVNGAGTAMKCGLPDGNYYDAVLVGVDPVGDVAMIKLLGRSDFPTATFGDSDQLVLGGTVFAVGNPFLLAYDFEPTITMGIVSGLHRYQYPSGTLLEYTDCIQTDASINPGNSGGPLFNDAGELVGINGRGSFEKRGRVSVGVGYAISINQIKNFLEHLRGGLIIDHATLGANVATDAEGRPIVAEILTTSDAYRRGLRVDDEIVSFAGRPIGSVNAFKNVLGIFPKGWRVPLVYRRDGERHEIRTRLTGVHREDELQKRGQSRPRATPKPRRPPQPGEPPAPPAAVPKRAPVPDAAKPFIEERAGFANYHFNRTRRDELLAGVKSQLGDGPRGGLWKLTFAQEGGEKAAIEVVLAADRVHWKSGNDEILYAGGQPEKLDPPGAAGLLVALEQWRRMLIDQTKWFSRCDFAGAQPDASGAVRLIIAAERGGIETTWLFDAKTSALRGLECIASEDGDPCEVLLDDYRPASGRLLPHRWEVYFAGHLVRRMTLQRAEFTP